MPLLTTSVITDNDGTQEILESSSDHPCVFWSNDRSQMIPDSAWTPLHWGLFKTPYLTAGKGWSLFGDRFLDARSTYVLPNTTIAAGSNGQALPQGTINVASTEGFEDSGYIVVRISLIHRVVKYTGKTATTFTGCTGGVGTMATGNLVEQGNVEFRCPNGDLAALVGECAWASHATGIRGIRVNFGGGLAGGTSVIGAVAATNPALHVQTAEQPAHVDPTTLQTPMTIEVWQNSGNAGGLETILDSLAAPRLVASVINPISRSKLS